MPAAWRRPSYVLGGAPGEVALIALARTKMPDPLPISRTRHGMPAHGSGPGAIDVVARDRADDPTWFVTQVISPFVDMIASDLGADAAAAALASEHAYVIEGSLADPDDLGHIQAAWAIAKCLGEEGAAVVIDVYAARAHLGSDVAALAPDRAFDIMHEMTMFFDEVGDGTLAAWTLGMRKFGRPDLVLLGVAPDGATDAAVLMRDVTGTLAAGERVEPGDVITLADGRQLTAARFDPEMSSVVAVDGAAILLR